MRSAIVSTLSALISIALIVLAGWLFVLVARHQLSNAVALLAAFAGVVAWWIGSHELESFRTPRRRSSDRSAP